MRAWLKRLTIRQKIILYMYLVLLPVLFAASLFVMIRQYRTNQEELRQRRRYSMVSLAATLGMVEENARNLSLNLTLNDEIRAILTTQDADVLNADPLLWKNKTAMAMVEELIALEGSIRTVAIYPENGVVPYLRCLDASAYQPDLSAITSTQEYLRARERGGKTLWVAQPKGMTTIYSANRFDKVVLCRCVPGEDRETSLAFLSIGITGEYLYDLCRKAILSEEEQIFLMNAEGELLLSYPENMLDAAFAQEHMEALAGGAVLRDGTFDVYGEISGEGYWTVALRAPHRGVLETLGVSGLFPLLLLLLLGAGIAPMVLLAAHIITRPLKEVCEAMEAFQLGDFDQTVPIRTYDEIGQVASCFNKMAGETKELIERNYVYVLRERESELAMLQAQINPHFLYNALDTIYWQALGEDDEATAESIYQLSQLFRLVLGRGKGIVTVETELQLVKRYLEIQKLRFDQKLSYQIEQTPEAAGLLIPKLILQPFVENAVVHGMSEKRDDFCIRISCHVQEDDLYLQVEDNGTGMTKEQLSQLWEKEAEHVYAGQRVGRYGVRNVKERLELTYMDGFDLKIESEPGKGTTVKIRVSARLTSETEDIL